MTLSGVFGFFGWTIVVAIAFGIPAFISLLFRIVVSTNDVDIVQSARKTVSYGRGQTSGNVYYRWPSWVPVIGVRTIRLPVSVLRLELDNYAAYDKGRVPFMIDIVGFFRVIDSNVAAERVSDMKELNQQLEFILKGAIRSILATSEIEDILEGRAHFGVLFTEAVEEQLKQWGVGPVKSIELMDIRDAQGSHVIENIMAKKKSQIEKESRVVVAGNMREAQVAEVEAAQAVEVRKREAEQLIGQRTADRDREVGISTELSRQAIKDQEAVTKTKEMAVTQISEVRAAEITRDVQIVQANRDKTTTVIDAEARAGAGIAVAEGEKQMATLQAEGEKAKIVIAASAAQERATLEGQGEKARLTLVADGTLATMTNNAKGIAAEGEARGRAATALAMAPVTAQISLAQEIGNNAGYQTYLVQVRKIEAEQAVGVAQAGALENADIKVIANTGVAMDGVKSALELLTTKGGTQIGGMLEALGQTPVGAEILSRVTGAANGHAA